MRYHVRLIGYDHLHPQVLADTDDLVAAMRAASDHAWDGDLGTAVLDTTTGLLHIGEPDQWLQPDEVFPPSQ